MTGVAFRVMNISKPALVTVLNVTALLLCFALLMQHNFSFPGMWWDEAAQFWISQGLINYAKPFSVPGGLGEVVYHNYRENLDPGGFSLLAHYWTKISTDIAWLRLMPLLFLLWAVLAVGWLAFRLTRSVPVATAMMLLPLIDPHIL